MFAYDTSLRNHAIDIIVLVTADEKAIEPLNGSGFCLKCPFPHDRIEAIV